MERPKLQSLQGRRGKSISRLRLIRNWIIKGGKFKVAVLVTSLLAFGGGFIMGEAHAITICARVGIKALELSGVEIPKGFIEEVLLRWQTMNNGFIGNLTQ